jgi:hypothetical protein
MQGDEQPSSSVVSNVASTIAAAIGLDSELLDELRSLASHRMALEARLQACSLAREARAQMAVALLAEHGCRPLYRLPATRTVLRCAGGLCNRLRTLLSFALLAAECGGTLEVVWVASDQCPGSFTEHFEPPPGCHLVEAPISSRKASTAFWNRHLARLIERGAAGDEEDMKPVAVVEASDYHVDVKGHAAREALCWSLLRPRSSILHAVADNKRALQAAGAADGYFALHIRRTDHTALAKHKQTSDADFERFVTDGRYDRRVDQGVGEAFDGSNCTSVGGTNDAVTIFFLATDCAGVRRTWCERHSQSCIVGSHHMSCESNADVNADASGDLRQTTLHASIVDLLTCVDAVAFKGSTCSSFSDAISRLRMARGTANVSDEHECCDPPR